MISPDTESQIIKLLLTLADLERQVEINRQVLSQNLDFDAYQAFRYIDTDNKNSINSENLLNFLNKNGICTNLNELQYLILFYDENQDGCLSYTEFLNMILSESNYSLRKLARERIGSTFPKINLPFNVEYSIVKLFEKELYLIREISCLINFLKSKCDFNTHELYHLIKGNNEFIKPENIKNFLLKNSVKFNDDDIRNIMKRLDFNRDSKIDYCEFHKFFCGNVDNCSCCNICTQCCFNTNSIRTNYSTNNSFQNQFINNQNNNYNNQIPSDLTLTNSPMRNSNQINLIPLNSNKTNYNYNNNIKVSPNLTLRNSPQRKNSPCSNRELNPNNYIVENNNCQKTICCPNNCNNCICNICKCNPCRCIALSYERGECTFINFIREIMNIENQIENYKIELSLRSDFNIEDAFKIFELNGRGIINEADLKYGLNLLDIYASDKDIKLIMRRADIRKNNLISYADFFDLIVPFEKNYRNMIENRLPSNFIPKYNKADVFMLSTKIYFQNLIRLIINLENKLEKLRYCLGDAKSQLNCIFKNMDRCKRGFITDEDLNYFMKCNGICCTDREIGLAFIRFDKNRNGKVELWEIADELNLTGS